MDDGRVQIMRHIASVNGGAIKRVLKEYDLDSFSLIRGTSIC